MSDRVSGLADLAKCDNKKEFVIIRPEGVNVTESTSFEVAIGIGIEIEIEIERLIQHP